MTHILYFGEGESTYLVGPNNQLIAMMSKKGDFHDFTESPVKISHIRLRDIVTEISDTPNIPLKAQIFLGNLQEYATEYDNACSILEKQNKKINTTLEDYLLKSENFSTKIVSKLSLNDEEAQNYIKAHSKPEPNLTLTL